MIEQTLPDRSEHEAAADRDAASAALQDQAFAKGVSHDLRAPLRAIDSFSALLAEHAGAALDATGQGYLQRIRDASARMGRLLDALQEYSLASRATLRREPVDLSLLADWVGAELQDFAQGRAARIDVVPGLQVQGDEQWLRTLLMKLMRNAWNFSATRERVEIDVEGERAGDTLRLRVRDRGIGFDPEYADKLFQPFQRLHGPHEGAGAGMGLAIAQCIAQRHGGRIRAESVPGEGSVFHLELPAGAIERAQRDG